MGIDDLPGIIISGNFPEELTFQGSTSLVSIYMNGSLLLEEQYEPSEGFIISMRLRDLFHSLLETVIPVSGDMIIQDRSCADFRIEIPTQSGIQGYNFRLIKGGIDSSIVDSSNFLVKNFLTWKPQVKKVKYLDPQWLTYYNMGDARFCVQATYLEDNDLITSEKIILQLLPPHQKCTFNTKFEQLWQKFAAPERSPYYIDCWMEDEAQDKFTYVQRYVLSDDYHQFDDLFVFENSLGGIDVIRFTGESESSLEHEFKSALFGRENRDYLLLFNRIITKNTGYFRNSMEMLWTADFLASINRHQYIADIPVRIIIKSFEAKSIKTELNHYTFIYYLSKQSAFLNGAAVSNQLPGMMGDFSGNPSVFDDIYVRVYGDQTIDGSKTFLEPIRTNEIQPATGSQLTLNNLVVADGGIIDCGQF